MKQKLILLFAAWMVVGNIFAETYSGYCGEITTEYPNGENLVWSFDSETHALTITGSGRMLDEMYAGNFDWFDYFEDIYSLVLPDGLTNIGNYAFWQFFNLTSVEIPNSVTSIGESAFDGCESLVDITIPNSVTSIGENAFSDCSNLINITIPNSVTSIGKGAFFSCESLTSITIPNSVTTIGQEAFRGCSSLTAIHVDAENPNYVSDEGTLLNKDKTILIAYPAGKQGAYTIPNSVTEIGSCAFYGCSGLTDITIPTSVTNIGDYAFSGCSGLTNITIPNSVTNIGHYVFNDCNSLTEINVDAGNQTYSSENGVLFNEDKTTLIRYPQNKKGAYTIPNSVDYLSPSAFKDCTGLTRITTPDTETRIGTSCFSGCSNLTSITFSNSIKGTISFMFISCTKLVEVVIVEHVSNLPQNICRSITNLRVVHDCSGLLYNPSEECKNDPECSGKHPAPNYIDEEMRTYLGIKPAVNIEGCTRENHKGHTWADFELDLGDGVLTVGGLEGDEKLTFLLNLTIHAVEDEKPLVQIFHDGDLSFDAGANFWYKWTVKIGRNYFVSLPSDVAWDDITYWTGTTEDDVNGTWSDAFNMNFYEYNGANRAANGYNDAGNWVALPYVEKADGTNLLRGKGLAFNVEPVGDLYEGDEITIRFPIDKSWYDGHVGAVEWTETVAENHAADKANSGWNLIGNPYLTKFDAKDLAHTEYVNIYNSATNSYTQLHKSEAMINPMTSFFVQVDADGDVPFELSNRYLEIPAAPEQEENEPALAPRRVQGEAVSNRLQAIENRFSSTRVGLTLDGDNMGLVIGEDYTPDYEINADLIKMFADGQETAVYTAFGGKRLAYLALTAEDMVNVPVGYILKAGEHRFTSPNPSQGGEMIEHLYLLDKVTGVTTDLLVNDYTFTTNADEAYNESRFEISAIMSTTTPLNAEGAEVQSPQKFIHNGKLYINVNGVIYNALGQIVK